MPSTQFGMFAKFWQPGEVKTRLAREIGNEAAARLYRAFIDTLLTRFNDVGDERTLAFSPAERANEFAQLVGGKNWKLRPQGDGDLGTRMGRHFVQAFSAAVERAVLIGSDSPTLPREFVEQAFALLEDNSVVLGPSEDGGYYLIGLAGGVPPIFNEMPWSTPQVWNETLNRLQAARLKFAVLPTWYDVDEAADLRRLAIELTGAVESAAEWPALRRAVHEAESIPTPENRGRSNSSFCKGFLSE
jgi:rSAM/selenodomain-associated transferase 1